MAKKSIPRKTKSGKPAARRKAVKKHIPTPIVTNEEFCITLNFGNSRETMKIPFASIKSFVDPSVEFGLSFDSQLDSKISPPVEVQTDSHETLDPDFEVEKETPPERKSGEVVSLESFRKP